MMVTDIVKALICCTEYGEWVGEEYPDLDEAVTRYNEKQNRFLYYPWGVFVTSFSRRNLYSGILEFTKNNKCDYIYSDTDSIKCLNIQDHMEYINNYNLYITKQIDKVLKSYGLDPELARPKNKKGEAKQIGVWDWETKGNPYTDFKTLGAKRYMYRQNGEIHITIAGANKKMGRDFISRQKDPFGFFSNDMEIAANYSGKLTHTYLDEPQDGTLIDYQGNTMEYHEESSVHLEPASYSMNVLKEYEDYCKGVKKDFRNGAVHIWMK